MDSKSNNQVAIVGDWTVKELDTLKAIEESGAKPISTTLATQMFQLFLEGYTCAEIAKQNKGFTEGDILYCRKKYKWDNERDEYVIQLNNQIKQKIMKQKLESAEFLTNMLSVIHKEHRDVMLKYLQTGNPDDLPKIGSLRTYKEVVEILSKITGEDSTKRIKLDAKIQQDTNVKVENPGGLQLSPELQTKLLKALSDLSEQDSRGKKKSE